MATTRPPPSPRLPSRQDTLPDSAYDSVPVESPSVAEQDMERAAQSALGLSPRSPRSPLVQQSTPSKLGANEGASGDSEGEDEADINTLMKQGATREQAVAWIKEDRERLARDAMRATAVFSPGSQLTSSPESYRHSEASPALHPLTSDELFPSLPPLPTPALDPHDPYAPTIAPQSYDHMRALEALERSEAWRQGSASAAAGAIAERQLGREPESVAEEGSYFPSIQGDDKGKVQKWLIEELVKKRDAERVDEAKRSGRNLGEETRRLWRHLDRSQMEAGPHVVNGYNLSLATKFRDLQSPPPLSPPSHPHSTSADPLPSSCPNPQSDSYSDIFDAIDAQDDPRADTPLPRAPRQPNVYQSPDEENPFTSAVREKPFQTLGQKFLPSRGSGIDDTTWTKETGKVLDLGGRPTLYRDRIGMANWGRTLLSPIVSESELTASTRSRLTSPSLSYVSSTSTAKSPIRRRPSDPLSAAAIERARLPSLSASTTRRAREGTTSTSLTARALESLTSADSDVGSSSAAVEIWRENERRRQEKAEKEQERARTLTGGLDTLSFVKNTMLEQFGIDLTQEEGPTPPYQEREAGSSAGRTSSSRAGEGTVSQRSASTRFNADLVPKELIPLLRQYVRMREGDLKAAKSNATRLPDDYRHAKPFPPSHTNVYSAQINAPRPSNPIETTTSIDPSSTTPPSSPPKAASSTRSPRSRQPAVDDGQRRMASPTTAKSTSPPDIFSDDVPEDSGTFTLAPLAPSGGEPSPPRAERLQDSPPSSSVPPTSRQPQSQAYELSPQEKARRKALRKAGGEPDPAPARQARRDSVFTGLVELNKEKARLHALLPRQTDDYSTSHVPTLNALAQLIIDAKGLKSTEMYDEAAMYYQQSLRLDPNQSELGFFIGKWNAYKADVDREYSAHYQQQALGCFLSAIRFEPTSSRYHMELARAYVNQEVPLETDEPKEMLAIRALKAAVKWSPPCSDTRIVAYYRMHFTWRMLARSAEDGDPAKLELYRQALWAIEACGNEALRRERTPEDQRPPSTGEILPPAELIRKSEKTIREECEEYRSIAEAMEIGSPNLDLQAPPTLRRATEPALASARMDEDLVDDRDPRPSSSEHRTEPLWSPAPRRRDLPPADFSPTQQDLDHGTPPRSKTAPPPTIARNTPAQPTDQSGEKYQGATEAPYSPRRRQRSSTEAPRTRTVGVQVGRTRSQHRSRDAGVQTELSSPSRTAPFDHATDLIDDGILKLQSLLSLSQQRQTKRVAAEATEVHQSLAQLQDQLIASIKERNVQAAALTRSLQEVLKELEGLPLRIQASARLAQLRHESAHPIPPSTNPISFTLAKLRKAKEASKALRRK
ncbi:hypothetical protein BCR35DRAFT_336248 [Leucosporidium creatinivorum]|uniref:Uncharacterized protein n=1 Tax=Leucosporidium creatinivorum TaxID=106004 RepID=A0A1Y2CHQ3_9BASI|nr:hypothetical protein BCR35DRAFT_336248 [Leucosporidium creatinivorum]